jgi:hypothetical protein
MSPRVDPPALVLLGRELEVDEHVSPGVHLLSVVSVNNSLQVNLGIAVSPSVGVTHVVPVHAECSVFLGSEETIIVVLSGEVLVGICPELGGSGAVVLPSLSSMSSLMTLSSPQDRDEHHGWVASIAL